MIPARQGREKQRYDDGIRLVAGCVPLTKDGKLVIVESSSKPNTFVLPKGGWDNDETATEAAARELYEEAGVRGQFGVRLADHEASSKKGRTRFHFWLVYVDTVLDDWPEASERKRHFVDPEEATAMLTRPEQVALVAECRDRGLFEKPLRQ